MTDNFSVLCIPRFEVVTLQKDAFFYSADFNKGSIGTAILISELLRSFEQSKTPATVYLYGLGVLSNESSKNFNFDADRPDLVICTGAIKPRVLIDVKYQSTVCHEENFESHLNRLTSGTGDILLCNLSNIEGYLKESKKMNCPIYIVKVYRVEMSKKKSYIYKYLGLELEEGVKFLKKATPKGASKEVYYVPYSKMLQDSALFDQLRSHIK
jgi:hypothetical protein